MRSIETWIETIWELVAVLASMLTCRLFSTSHSTLMPRQETTQQLPPSLVLALGEHKTKKLSFLGC